ncbi:MAG TPA: error-prone DNA polymerase [Steroidobacteraceae bacterium]|nr:error-prone DNA polymerase [Steroidobacteraceae bacterium]
MYAELHALSNFTFLRGASQPAELVARAAELGYRALAVTDECSVAGVVRAHVAAKDKKLPLLIGAEFRLAEGLKFVALAADRKGYGALASFITCGRRAAAKGSYRLTRADLEGGLDRCLLLWLPGPAPDADEGRWLRERFEGRLWLAVELLTSGNDRRRLAALEQLGAELELPCVASGDVHMHVRGRRALQDVLTAVRLRTPVAAAGLALCPNGERHLRPLARLLELYPRVMLDASLDIVERCRFSLDELRYEYPEELVPPGETAPHYLRRLTEEGVKERWPGGEPAHVRDLIERELALIADLQYEPYFLTVHDLVRFARSAGILCQGRGSAANSAVCYCLGVTEVDPVRCQLLFERFISRERNEPPDIDIDFEHERREEVIQYVYRKYGRERAAIAATVVTYHAKSALRDVGKALGLDELQVDRLARAASWTDGLKLDEERVREAGFDPANPLIGRLIVLTRSLLGFPRHLSQHVGGFVISRGRLDELVPLENAAMADRTVIEWDKDDLDDLGLLKVDVLGLGMLSAIRRAFGLIAGFRGRPLTMAGIEADDPRVYDMICRADTTGVFQIESRAQMAMLPRLKPRNYYDLVIEVALVRPGPIQGDMVHPYLRRRSGAEQVTYPSEAVRQVLKRTLGVPIFQEQVMQLAIVAAGFSPGEADRLRRAMAAWKRRGGLEPFEERLKQGMLERNYTAEFAQQIYRQILGFGEYGFPESHAASFALLVYVSAWLKCHEPAAFAAALINSQPMGFYAPAQLVRDARNHGVEVCPIDIAASDWDVTLEAATDGEPAMRLGFRMVKGLPESAARRIVKARAGQRFTSMQDLASRAALDRRDLGALARAGALKALSGNRHRASWAVAGVEPPLPLIENAAVAEGIPLLRAPTEGQDIVADYRNVGLTLGRHPLALLRERLDSEGVRTAADLWGLRNGDAVRTAGLVITRQRPMTASGVTFVTLEDETGHINLVVWLQVAERQRRALIESRLLEVSGELQREGEVLHVIVQSMRDRSRLLGALKARSRDFH